MCEITIEEAIRQIRDNIDFRKRLQEGDKPQFFDVDENEKDIEAFEMAIQALSEEPCEDAISRQAVDDAIYDYSRSCDVNYGQIMERIDKIPSVKSKQTDALDKIRAEIKEQYGGCGLINDGLDMALSIIEKYMAESEEMK